MESQDQYTWKQFQDAVLDLLTVDKVRAGIDSYRVGLIRQGVIHLQSIIPEFRILHETLYYPQDLVVEGRASRGVKPPQSAIRDVFLVKINSDKKGCVRYPMDTIAWHDRFHLVNGTTCVNGGRAQFCVDPQGYTFYVYPEVFDCWMLSMFWDGLKLDFKDDEATPFVERMVLAVSYFVKAHIKREIEHDLAGYESYMKSFNMEKPMLFVDAKEKASKKG